MFQSSNVPEKKLDDRVWVTCYTVYFLRTENSLNVVRFSFFDELDVQRAKWDSLWCTARFQMT